VPPPVTVAPDRKKKDFDFTRLGVRVPTILLSPWVERGVSKTPFFGFLIAILGCYFGLQTRGGTEGVGRSTTRSVVVVSISILMADALLTQIFVSFGTL